MVPSNHRRRHVLHPQPYANCRCFCELIKCLKVHYKKYTPTRSAEEGMNVAREEWGIKDLRPEKCFQVNPLGNENPATVAPFSRSLTPNDSIEMSDYIERNSRPILYLPRERTKLLTNNIYLKRTYDLHDPRYLKIMATRGVSLLEHSKHNSSAQRTHVVLTKLVPLWV